MRTCQKCGAEVEKDDKFCPECGEKVVKETRTITVWSILKVLLIVIFFIILINVFKSMSGASPVLFLIVIILFVLWSGILNWLLGKLFNVKISTGVKLILSIAILLILFFGAKMATNTSAPMINRVAEKPPIGEDEAMMYNIVEEINSVFNYKNDRALTVMVEKGVITGNVFEDLQNVLIQSGSLTIILKPRNNKLSDTHAEMETELLLSKGPNERRQGVILVFERKGPTWTLIKISPRLTDIKLEKSFEEETDYKIKQIPQPTDASKQLVVKITPDGTKEGYY